MLKTRKVTAGLSFVLNFMHRKRLTMNNRRRTAGLGVRSSAKRRIRECRMTVRILDKAAERPCRRVLVLRIATAGRYTQQQALEEVSRFFARNFRDASGRTPRSLIWVWRQERQVLPSEHQSGRALSCTRLPPPANEYSYNVSSKPLRPH